MRRGLHKFFLEVLQNYYNKFLVEITCEGLETNGSEVN